MQVQAPGEFEDDVQWLVGQGVHGDGVLVDAEEIGELPRGQARVVQAAAQFLAPARGLVARGRVEAVSHRSGPSSERITTSMRRAVIHSVRGAGPAPIPATSHMPRWSQNGLTPIRRQVRPIVSTSERSERREQSSWDRRSSGGGCRSRPRGGERGGRQGVRRRTGAGSSCRWCARSWGSRPRGAGRARGPSRRGGRRRSPDASAGTGTGRARRCCGTAGGRTGRGRQPGEERHGGGGRVGGDGGAQGPADVGSEPGGQPVRGGWPECGGLPAQQDAAGEQGRLDRAEPDEGEASASGGAEAFVAQVGIQGPLEGVAGAAFGEFVAVTAYKGVGGLGLPAVGEVELLKGVPGESAAAGGKEEGEVGGGQRGPVGVGVGVLVGLESEGERRGRQRQDALEGVAAHGPYGPVWSAEGHVPAGGALALGSAQALDRVAQPGRTVGGGPDQPQVGVGPVGEFGELERLAGAEPVGALDEDVGDVRGGDPRRGRLPGVRDAQAAGPYGGRVLARAGQDVSHEVVGGAHRVGRTTIRSADSSAARRRERFGSSLPSTTTRTVRCGVGGAAAGSSVRAVSRVSVTGGRRRGGHRRCGRWPRRRW